MITDPFRNGASVFYQGSTNGNINLKPEVAEVTYRADNTIELEGDDAAKMQKLLDALEDLDDVQEVYHNAEINE